jgi:hypothetical protein
VEKSSLHPANPLFLACSAKTHEKILRLWEVFSSLTREREELETIEDLIWAKTTIFGLSETTRDVAVVEDAKSLVHLLMKAKSGPKPQE